MIVQELIQKLLRYPADREVYVYDEHADLEREITDVGPNNPLMQPGTVISIRGTLR